MTRKLSCILLLFLTYLFAVSIAQLRDRNSIFTNRNRNLVTSDLNDPNSITITSGTAIIPPSTNTSSSSSTSIDPEIEEQKRIIMKKVADSFFIGEARLMTSSDTQSNDPGLQSPCPNRTPYIMTKIDGIPKNPCPGSLENDAMSCTCVDGYEGSNKWEFHIKNSKFATESSTVLNAASELNIGSISSISVPGSLKTLCLKGEGEDKPVPITFASVYRPDVNNQNGIPLVESLSARALKQVYFYDIDLSGALKGSNLLPDTISSLVLQNCNLDHLPPLFLESFKDLEQIDLSGNRFTSIYDRLNEDSCQDGHCWQKVINLTNNAITEFPAQVLNLDHLEELYLSGNAIQNITISREAFNTVKKLRVLTIDKPEEPVECPADSTSEIAHDAIFCVSTVSVETESNDDSALSYTFMLGGVIMALLMVLLIKLSLGKEHPNEFKAMDDGELLPRSFHDTIAYDSDVAIDLSLLNDPMIITNRIPYGEVQVGPAINKGGFGIIYSGVFNRRRVAIKKIRPEMSGEGQHIETFLKEISLMAKLKHPNIVEFVGVAWDSLRNLSAVTEYMERGDLCQVLKSFKNRNSPLTWEEHKTQIALHVAEALTYLHSLDPIVLHRDLKSKNIMLSSTMETKLSDFGVSRQRWETHEVMTAGVGTSFWIAPEVLLGKDYDERADMYSFGVVLSELDTDDTPYWNANNPPPHGGTDKEEAHKILRRVASGRLVPSFTDNCPGPILELAQSCLQTDPNNRPSAANAAYTLQRYLSATIAPEQAQSTPVVTSSMEKVSDLSSLPEDGLEAIRGSTSISPEWP